MDKEERTVLDYPTEICRQLYSLQQAKFHCDVTIVTKTDNIYVHKVVLLACKSPLMEREIMNSATVTLFQGENFALVKKIVKSLYTGELDITKEDVCSMQKIYVLLKLENFVKVCEDYIGKVNDNDVLCDHEVNKCNVQQLNIDNGGRVSGDKTTEFQEKIKDATKKLIKVQKRKKAVTEDPEPVKKRLRSSSHGRAENHSLTSLKQRSQTTRFSRSKRGKGCKRGKHGESDDFLENNDSEKLDVKSEHSTKTDNKDTLSSVTDEVTQDRMKLKRKQDASTRKNSSRMEKICAHCDKNEKLCKCTISNPKGFRKKCPKCNLRFLDRGLLYVHTKSEHGARCSMCDYQNVKESMVAQHMYTKHKVIMDEVKYPVLKCEDTECSFSCIEVFFMRNHREERHKDPEFVCKECGKTFGSGIRFRMHMKSHDPRENKYVCDVCGKKFHQQGLLNSHMNQIHTRMKMCHLCPWTGKHSKEVTAHLYSRHGVPLPDDVKIFKCDQCDYVAFYPKKLRDHKVRHTGEKSFQCQECGKLFSTSDHLRGHARMHQEKTVLCEFPGCDYKCTSQHKLKLHNNSRHMDEKPFSCHLCPYSCKLRGNLDKHLRGTHKLSVTTSKDLWQKLTEEGKGYDKILERRRKIQNREAIPLPVPPTPEERITKLDDIPEDVLDDRDFPPRYDGSILPFNSHVPYTSIPMVPGSSEPSLIQYPEFPLDNTHMLNSWT